MNDQLVNLIHELQSVPALDSFALAGGTNLAIRFEHRRSDDIDLFTNDTIGIQGWHEIQKAISEHFKDSVIFNEILNIDEGDQFCFLRCLIRIADGQVKVDMIQNVKHMDPFEMCNGIKMFTVRDIGLFKLMTTTNRKAKKDVYDLDLITDQLDLDSLLTDLREKAKNFNQANHKCLFDLDPQIYPFDNLNSLLAFDETVNQEFRSQHAHSSDRIDIINGKSWLLAKATFRRKVKRLLQD